MAVDYKLLMDGDSKKLIEALKESDKALAESMKQVARLDKKLKDLERQMKESKDAAKSFDSIKKAVSDAIPEVGDLVSGFAKLGTVAGAAGLAAKGIKDLALTALNAGQSIDSFTITVNAAKSTFGTLADALFKADWSKFSAGIFKASVEFEKMKDEIEDISRSYNRMRKAAQSAVSDAREIYSEEGAPDEQKAAAKEKAKEAIAKLEEKRKKQEDKVNEMLKQSSKKEAARLSDSEREDLFNNFEDYDYIYMKKKMKE
jgi:HAMP domain-containing protein